MTLQIWIINKAINNDENLQPIKTILGAWPSVVSQKVIPAAISPACGSLALVSVKSIPQCPPHSSPWVNPCISSFQLINSAAGWHHTLLPWPHSLCWAQGKEGLQMLLLSYFWHTPGVWAGWLVQGIAPILRGFHPALGKVRRRSPDTWKPGSGLCPTLQNQSTRKFTGFPQFCCLFAPQSWVLCADISPEPFGVGWEQLLAGDSESLQAPRCTQTGNFSQAVIAIRARDFTPNCFKVI